MSINRIVLHAGKPKTGSTTIQHALADGRAELLRRGVLYPSSPGRRNHMKLVDHAAPTDDIHDLRRLHGITDSTAVERFRRTFEADLARELGRTSASTVVFSNEHCSVRLRDTGSIERLVELLHRFAPRIDVVVYLRRQDDSLISSYSQYVKGGGTRGVPDYSDEEFDRIRDHWDTLQRWEQVVGRDALVVRVFEREQLVGGDLLTDFLDAAGLPPELILHRPEAANSSLDAASVELLRRMNEHLPPFIDGERNALRGDLVRRFEQWPSTGGRTTVSRAVAEEYFARFAESNRRVAETYLGRPDGRLFLSEFGGASTGDDEPSTLDLETAVEIFSFLWARKQEELDTRSRSTIRTRARKAVRRLDPRTFRGGFGRRQ